MMTQGHTGPGRGMAILLEAASRIMGKVGKRQVKDAKIAIATSCGGTGMDFYVTALGREV